MGTRSMLQADNYVNWKIPSGSAHATLSVAGSVVSLPAPTQPCEAYWVQVTVDAVRITVDGSTAPAAGATGFLLSNGTTIYLSKEMAAAAKFIRETNTATIQYQIVAW